MGPSLITPAGGWCAVHDGALWAPMVCGAAPALTPVAGTMRDGGPKGPIVYSAPAGAQRAPSCTARQPPAGARSEGPVGP